MISFIIDIIGFYVFGGTLREATDVGGINEKSLISWFFRAKI